MTDQDAKPAAAPTGVPTSASAPAKGAPASVHRGPTIHIADEFGTAKRNLPPVKILVVALAGVLVIAALVAFFQRAKPQATGSLDNITAVQIPNQTASLVALTFTLRSSAEKSLWVHSIRARLATSSGDQISDAVSSVDFDRYYSAFPDLKANAQPALAPEDKLQPGQELKRTVLVSFPVSLDEFDQRKSISVIVQPYDQPVPVVLTK
jgi:hypothetical protein